MRILVLKFQDAYRDAVVCQSVTSTPLPGAEQMTFKAPTPVNSISIPAAEQLKFKEPTRRKQKANLTTTGKLLLKVLLKC